MSIKDITTRMFYCLLKISLLECFIDCFVCFLFVFGSEGWGREGSIMNGFPHQLNDFSADTKQNQINY